MNHSIVFSVQKFGKFCLYFEASLEFLNLEKEEKNTHRIQYNLIVNISLNQ